VSGLISRPRGRLADGPPPKDLRAKAYPLAPTWTQTLTIAGEEWEVTGNEWTRTVSARPTGKTSHPKEKTCQ
jgi:hypothetical protein